MSEPYDPYRSSEPESTYDPYRSADSSGQWTPPADPTQDAPSPYGSSSPTQDDTATGYLAHSPHLAYSTPVYAQQQPQELNQLALIGFIASVVGFATCVGFVAGLILGYIALSQIKQQPHQGGRGLAVAAIVIGLSGIALSVVGVVVMVLVGFSFSN